MPETRALLLLLSLAAYLCGSIPFGLLVGLSRGVDPRRAGSGNIGATNVGRLLGGKFFAAVFILDLLKGTIPVLLAGWILQFHPASRAQCLLWMLVGLGAILGHMFSIFIGFKGGKGVATSTGVVLGIFPFFTAACGLAVLAFLIVFYLSRYVSLASIVGAIIFPLAYAALAHWMAWPIMGTQLPLLCFAILIALMIVYKHRGNIARLRAGTENRFVKKANAPQ